MGYDDEAIYINTRCFQFGGGLLYNKIRIISKAELYASNGGPLSWKDIWDIRSPISLGEKPDVIRPSISYTAGNGGYFLWANNGGANFYLLYRILNPLTSPRLRAVSVPTQYYGSAPDANQLGGGRLIDAIGSWMYGAPIAREGKLYAAHSIQNSQFSSNSSAKYLIIDLNSNQISEQSELGAQGYYYLYSTLTVDQNKNIAVTFSRSADTEYIGAYYSTKHFSSPPGLNPSLPFKEGQGNYVNGNPNRWGDYFGIYLDPNNFDVWMFTEYAAAINSWSTYVGHIRMVPFTGTYVYLKPDFINFGDVELGTTSSTNSAVIANYGDSDLIISQIAPLEGDFKLETSLSFPITLSSYDSLTIEFSYTPSVIGDTTILYPIVTNDPDFQGITLRGNCYEIISATEKTIYASSGIQNNGDIITIDPNSGAGSVIGSSLFSEVKGIAINPLNGIIYGIVSVSGPTKIVRVNSSDGDAHLLFEVDIPSPADIAFDTLGNCYCIGTNGEIYTVDLNNGDTEFIIDATGSYSGITFHPETNELWATSRSFLFPNKDAVFKVNLINGDTVIVGHTGLDKITNDLIFDENNILYGIIGTSSELNELITIDQLNGAGNIIGSVEMKHILSLAYINTLPTIVEMEEQNTPDDFALIQNYPNPFNPVTIIGYKISKSSFVTLKIYDILGREVATVVNEEKQSGFHEVQFDGGNFSSSIYYYKLIAGDFSQTKKMVLLK